MKFLLVFILFSTKLISGQTLDGIWYNENKNRFIEFKTDTCTTTNKFYYTTKVDTTGRYISNDFAFKKDSNILILKDGYYQTGIIFWQRKAKALFIIDQLSDSSLVLIANPKNVKKAAMIADLIGIENLVYKKVSKKYYYLIINTSK